MSNAPATRETGHATHDSDHTTTSITNGTLNGQPLSQSPDNTSFALPATSPAADSPATPISTAAVPDVKIDLDYPEQESDARHEPLPIKSIDPIDKLKDASAILQLGAHSDPGSPFSPSFICWPLTLFDFGCIKFPSPFALRAEHRLSQQATSWTT